jgi:hypothetical protein
MAEERFPMLLYRLLWSMSKAMSCKQLDTQLSLSSMALRLADGGHTTVLPSLCNPQFQEPMPMKLLLWDAARTFIVSWLLSGRPAELYVSASRGKQMKGEATRIAHVDSGICIRSEVLHGVICLEVHVNGLKKKKNAASVIMQHELSMEEWQGVILVEHSSRTMVSVLDSNFRMLLFCPYFCIRFLYSVTVIQR